MSLKILIKTFCFPLLKSLKTSKGVLKHKKGWLIHIEDSSGKTGWGEVAPINNDERVNCEKAIASFKETITRQYLENSMPIFPNSLRFGLCAALAELDGLVGQLNINQWLSSPESAFLISAHGNKLVEEIESLVKNRENSSKTITIKLKFGIDTLINEIKILNYILSNFQDNYRLRLDINGAWNREQANYFISFFHKEPRIEWIEQPLSALDIKGLRELSKIFPVALDESLFIDTSLRESWTDWQIRKPILEGDPRQLLKELENGARKRAISTTFETGIGLRWVHHLAALQNKGPTPTAPGLAPGWCPKGPLFSNNPEIVWESA